MKINGTILAISAVILFYVFNIYLFVSELISLTIDTSIEKEFLINSYFRIGLDVLFVIFIGVLIYGLSKYKKWVIPYAIILNFGVIADQLMWVTFFKYSKWPIFIQDVLFYVAFTLIVLSQRKHFIK